ncbi:MBG domain-containing protein [Ectopseudomonas mendocina]|uniref:MBG domain-containing protein n=1 Tax=Ectopseudomonas mendocina TaxID=300 RepID=A0A2R3QN84_ECTME|nr:MBG domain-containing protein [Pseudomonas mendocina]AVO53251.1 hypothetical protein C7A17_10870 [Pseudomonas mendocina]
MGNNDGNYAVTYADNTSSTIDKASITVTANGGSSTYGDNGLLNPGISATGLVNGETIAVLMGLSNSFGIDNTTNVGSHDQWQLHGDPDQRWHLGRRPQDTDGKSQ